MTTRTPVRPVSRADAVGPTRRQWPYFLAMFLVLALLGGGAYVTYRTPVLGLQELDITATSGGLGADVSDAVRSAAGLATGTPLITIDLNSLRRRVAAVPQVASAAVARHWPNTIVITVVQRVPVALTSANGSLYLLDRDGYPYQKVARSQVPAGLFTIALATPGPHDPSTLAAIAVVGAIKTPIRGAVASVSARSAYDVQLQLRDGRSVLWGSPDDNAEKMQVLPAVLDRPGKVYDVSDPDLVTVGN